MRNFRFKLASNKVPKLNCPYCGAKKHWQRYIDTEINEVLPERFGKCDNDNKCAEWNDPYKLGYAKDQQSKIQNSRNVFNHSRPKKPQPEQEPAFVCFEAFKQTLQPNLYSKNIFIQNLLNRVDFPFEPGEIASMINLYSLGTAPNGAICFPFIDLNGKIRGIQEKIFNTQNNTDKSKKYNTTWLHSRLYSVCKNQNKPVSKWLQEYVENERGKPASCFFGEHLLPKFKTNPVALVEAPKTALYCWLYFHKHPSTKNWVWLAVGALGNFTIDRIKVLRGRKVFVFPDLSNDGKTFKYWQRKAKEFEKQLPGTKFIFSDLLEKFASDNDRAKGKDIADYLIQLDWKLFRH